MSTRLALGAALVLACTERFPRPQDAATGTPAVVDGPAIGLDRRPVSTTCLAVARPGPTTTLIAFERVTTAPLAAPVEIERHEATLYVLEQGGKMLRLNEDGTSTSVVIDVSAKIVAGGEGGLLGFAFHPRFTTNGFVYLYYTVSYPTQPPPAGVTFQSALVRYHSNDGGLTLDSLSETRILTVDQPYSNHNGGTIAFGLDGFLYWGLGDGGSGGDPQNHAQDPGSLLGKMLRIDVDGSDPYSIPPGNPFAASGGRPEIYALGLRNPFRFRFDLLTGKLWAGDVGQSAREEIDTITLGGNYGWNVREGKICYPESSTCGTAGFIDPVVDHPRSDATSITGGVVYRGAGVPLLGGKYVYGDFGSGRLWSIPIDEAAPSPTRLDEGIAPSVRPSAFAIDRGGEIVFLDYGTGRVYRIIPGKTETPPEMPEMLGSTGCVDAADPRKSTTGLFPYDVNVAQWSDGATAERFLSIPDGATITSSADGRLALPAGSIVMKTLLAEGRRVETQFLLARPAGAAIDWDAYSYVWNEAQTDATLATGTTTVTLPSGRAHVIVDRATCLGCHQPDVTPTLGLEAAQLDRDGLVYGAGAAARTANPLVTLERLGMIATPVPRGGYTPLVSVGSFATAERRSRTYLHANCSQCHRGDALDLRIGGIVQDAQACAIHRAMQSTGAGRMPPAGTLLPDAEATGVVASWLTTLAPCP